MINILSAFRFLTCIPLPYNGATDPRQLGASSAWFPLVGVFVGAMLILGNYLLEMIFNPSVVAALLITLVAILTGGLHLDGLMDTADGLMGAQEPARILEIMRDSRIGAMGVLAAVLSLLLKWTLLTSLLNANRDLVSTEGLLLIPTFGRWSMVYALYFFPYARAEVGLGRVFAEGAGLYQLSIASFTSLLVAWFFGGMIGIITLMGVIIVTVILSRGIAKRIGGMTGDTYGAINEMNEVVALLFLVGLKG